MAPLEDHDYIKLCADLANCLSISIASARRQVDLAAAREGVKDVQMKKEIAHRLLDKIRSQTKSGTDTPSVRLDELLQALAEEENFMVED